MKKTRYQMKVRDSYCYGAPIYRRVWVDENGRYFVKYNGEVNDVTFAKDSFIAD